MSPTTTLVGEPEEYIEDVLIVSKCMNTFFHDKWILDLGCPVHICSKKEYFDTFQEKKICFISLGDGFTCDVMSVRTMKIKMFNGVVCTLDGVAYVSKMLMNLISLG